MASASDPWVQKAKTLSLEQTTKIECPLPGCGGSPSAMVGHNRRGYSIYCFRCGQKDFFPHGVRSVSEILESRKAREEAQRSGKMPSRCIPVNSPEVPSEAAVWLLKVGLSPERAFLKYGIMYDPKTQRVNVPIYTNPEAYLSRRIFSGGPKYFLAGHVKSGYKQVGRHSTETAIVVEDVLSAIKLDMCKYSSVCILGTSLTEQAAAHLSDFNEVIVWTDADAAGDKAWRQIRTKMSLYGVDVVLRVNSSKDPKYYSKEEIDNFIRSTYGR